MKSRHRPFTSVLITAICFSLVLAFVPDADAVTYTWDGGGNPDDGGNWSDQNNWIKDSGYPSAAADVAVLPAPTVARYITNNVATTIDTLIMGDYANSYLVLGADMEARYFDGDPNGNVAKLDPNGYTFTFEKGDTAYFAKITGDGAVVKTGTDQVTLNGQDNYTGSLTVSNGVAKFRAGAWDTLSGLTVENGGAAWLEDPTEDGFITNITLNGHGYGSRGALHFTYQPYTCDGDITVATDANIKLGSTITITLDGDIDGPGVLTLDPGSGEIDIGGSSITYSNKLIVTNGTVVISGDLPNITNIWVDAGGVLEGLEVQFPNADVIETNGGVWIQNLSATWTGGGDGSNWTDTANWSPSIVPTNTATIPTPASAETIVVNAPANLGTLVIADSALITVRFAESMEIGTIDPDPTGSNHKFYIDSGSTLTVHQCNQSYLTRLDGPGHFRKVGTSSVIANGGQDISGTITVAEGLLKFRAGAWDSAASLTVEDGGAAWLEDPTEDGFITNITLNGSGNGSYGALHFTYQTYTCDGDITAATDANIKVGSAITITLDGDIDGPGVLTIEAGSGQIDIGGTYNFAVDGASGNKIIADSGTIDISGATLVLTTVGVASESEYVVIDYSGAGSVSGEFATETLPEGWQIEYNGTANNPDCVVAERPPPGVVILVR